MGDKTHKQNIGHQGERVAVDFLRKQDFQLVDINTRTLSGEIDLIMRSPDGGIVFVEVKTVETDIDRVDFNFDPVDKLSKRKIQKLHLAIHEYIQTHGRDISQWRLDAVVVYLDLQSQQARCRHFTHIGNAW